MTSNAASRIRGVLGTALVLALVAAALFRSHLGTRLDGFTVDEAWHIVAGVEYVRTGNFRLNPEHPPLAKLVVGATAPADFRIGPVTPVVEKAQERELVQDIAFLENDSAAAQAAARRAMWGLHAVLLLALGAVTWRVFGLAWAAGTLGFLVIEPSISAHLPVVMTDLPLALSFGLAALCAGLLASGWRWRWALACGVAVGLALGSKHSALPGIAGIAVVLAIAALAGVRTGGLREFGRRALKLVVAAMVSLVLLWGQYGFRFHAGPDGSDGFNRAMEDKVSDLNVAKWREGIAFADRHRLLPRAYLWGLADTVRAGVEGRGQSSHRVWGVNHKGRAPWFTWPSIVAAKVPLALIALSLAGLLVLPWSRLSPAARWSLAVLLGGSAAHLLALMGSQGTYGGIRHALPLVVAMAVVAGAAVSWAWARRSRPGLVAVALVFALAIGMTIREPRLWEYHNELAGGTQDAWRYFGNEGLDLGQRFPELRDFHDRVIAPSGKPLFSGYWFGDQQARAAGMNYRRRVEGLDDENVEGIYDGYFTNGMSANIPEPEWNWDPEATYRDTRVVARFGYLEVREGRIVDPQVRAGSLHFAVIRYLYDEEGKDWALVARRLEEVVAIVPQHVSAGIELGNAYLRMGDVGKARVAYQRLLDQETVPLEELVRQQLDAQLSAMGEDVDPATLKPVRNPWME
jgi:hypothetical protein